MRNVMKTFKKRHDPNEGRKVLWTSDLGTDEGLADHHKNVDINGGRT